MGSFEAPQLVFHESEYIGRQGLFEGLLIGFLCGRFSRHTVGYPVRRFGSFETVLPIQPVKVNLSSDSFVRDRRGAEPDNFCVKVVDAGSAFCGETIKDVADPGFGCQLFAGGFFITGGPVELDAYQVVQYVERLMEIRPHIHSAGPITLDKK